MSVFKKGVSILFNIIILLLSIAQTVSASGKGYNPGIEGVLAASVPPPGKHWRIYNVMYDADTLIDEDGDEMNIDFELGVFAQAHRFVWITQKKILGADYGASMIIPVIATSFEIGAMGLKDSKVGLGDLFIEPLVLGWHAQGYDVGLGFGINLPTAEFDQTEPASPGNGYWSTILTFGGTVFFDDKKSLSASILTRTLFYGEQDETDFEPGAEFIFDFGFGKEIPVSKGLLVRPGLCGYGLLQITEDDGPNITDDKGSVYAMGAEVNFFWLPPSLFQANIRSLIEFGAKDETEGYKTVLTITKSF